MKYFTKLLPPQLHSLGMPTRSSNQTTVSTQVQDPPKMNMYQRKRAERRQQYLKWALKATQAAIAILCGYETDSGIGFSRFALEVVESCREEDMHDFLTVMGNINERARGTTPFPRNEIRPLLLIVGGMKTKSYFDAYDDMVAGQRQEHRRRALKVLYRLRFKDLLKLSAHLHEHGFKDLEVSMSPYTRLAASSPNYTEEQYISALRHAIDIIISAANPTTKEMAQKRGFKKWTDKLKSDSTGWWATNKFVMDTQDLLMWQFSRGGGFGGGGGYHFY